MYFVKPSSGTFPINKKSETCCYEALARHKAILYWIISQTYQKFSLINFPSFGSETPFEITCYLRHSTNRTLSRRKAKKLKSEKQKVRIRIHLTLQQLWAHAVLSPQAWRQARRPALAPPPLLCGPAPARGRRRGTHQGGAIWLYMLEFIFVVYAWLCIACTRTYKHIHTH